MHQKTCTVMIFLREHSLDPYRFHLIVSSQSEAQKIARKFGLTRWHTQRMSYESALEHQYTDATIEMLQEWEETAARMQSGTRKAGL
jgi:hypothetical protein